MFNDDEYIRYSRHFSLNQIGLLGQQKLKNAKVLCVGCGGLAASTVMYLAAAGVGTLGIMDDDVVEKSNLQRQIQFNTNDVGQKKVTVMKEKIVALNTNVQVNSYNVKLNDSNALDVISQFDIVIDCTDNFYSKYLINDACYSLGTPFIFASVFHFEGQISFFSGKQSPCFRCLFHSPPPSEMVPNCAEEGILGVLPGLLGALEATEAIKHIIGIGENLLGKILVFNALNITSTLLKFNKSSSCPICEDKKPFNALERHISQKCSINKILAISAQELEKIINNVVLIDVREKFEREICHIGGHLIPLSRLSTMFSELDKTKQIVVYCKSGKRSQDAARILLAAGFLDVSSLAGGILSWIDEIDSSLQKY